MTATAPRAPEGSGPIGDAGTARRVLWVVLGATGLLEAGNGVVFGLMAEIQDEHGLSTGALGWISGSLFAASLVGLLTLAGLADRGHARSMLIGALALAAASLSWFAVGDSLWEFVASRALSGLAVSLFLAASRAVVSRLDPEHAGANLGRLAAAQIGGFVLGPVLGALLFDLGGLALPFWTLAAATAIALTLLAVGAPALDHAMPNDVVRVEGRTGVDLLADRRVLGAALLALSLYLPVGAYDALWSRYLTDLGASTTFVGLSLTLYALPIVVLARRGGQLVDRIGPLRASRRALVVIVPVIVLYGTFDSAWLVAGVAMVEAFGQAVAGPAMQTAMARACPPERLGAGHGLGSAFGLSGAGLLASAAPAIYAAWGPGWLFGGVAAVCTAIAVVAMRLHGPDLPPRSAGTCGGEAGIPA